MSDDMSEQSAVEKGHCTHSSAGDQSPGISGEAMFVNTDSFEECNKNIDDTPVNFIVDVSANNSTNSSNPDDPSSFEEEKNNISNPAVLKDSEATSIQLSSQDEEQYIEEDFLTNPTWISKEKHIFIISESGKPIYTRYGKEDRLVTLYGLMQALVSFVADGDDIIRCINAGGHKFVFLIRSPLILVAVSKAQASVPQLVMQLTYVHSQLVSILTASALTKTFEKRRNYDFRRMLGGEGRLLDNLLGLMDHHPSFLLGAIQCLPLLSSIRETIAQSIIQYCSKIKNLVFGLLISNYQLIALVRMKKFLLHPADLHLLFNLVGATESLKVSENWMPICLPKFDPKGFLYGHVSYLSDECDACLILLSVEREHFPVLSEAKQKIVERLRRHHCLEKINQALTHSTYKTDSCGSSNLRHFLYKSKPTSQYTCPSYTSPYLDCLSQKKLFELYQLLHHRIHSIMRPLKMVFLSTSTETMVGWVTKDFELYCCVEPITSKANAVATVNKILTWVKTEENRLFILNSPTF